jgi:hypothetical protein
MLQDPHEKSSPTSGVAFFALKVRRECESLALDLILGMSSEYFTRSPETSEENRQKLHRSRSATLLQFPALGRFPSSQTNCPSAGFSVLMGRLVLFAFLGLAGCETTSDGPQSAASSLAPLVDLGRKSSIAFIAEQGGDVQALVQELLELFAARGYYELVDRSNLQGTMQERRFQQMSFVEGRDSDRIGGADVLVYVQADAHADQVAPSDFLGSVLAPYAFKTVVNYAASFRAIRTSSGEIVAARRLDLSEKKDSFSASSFNTGADSAPMVSRLRDQAAAQIFQSLHP